MPIIRKVDTVEDPGSRQWLESKIARWLQDTCKAVCGCLPQSSADSPYPPTLHATLADADIMRYVGNSGTDQFIPLRIQLPALAVWVADTEIVGDARDSVKAARNRIIEFSRHDPPLMRGVGQQIPSIYVAVLKLFGAIAEYGDDNRALEALRDDAAHALWRNLLGVAVTFVSPERRARECMKDIP